MEDRIILYIILFFVCFTCAYIIYFICLYKHNLPKENKKTEITGQRERIEDKIYDYQEIMFSDSSRLFDNTKLLLQFPSKNLVINQRVPNFSFFQDLGININNLRVKDRTVFCLMPFHKRFDRLYRTIHVACLGSGYNCSRSDVPFNPGRILQQIVRMMFESQLIIAVLDGKNPNVFYEIGIAHSIGKPVILLANYSSSEEIPFDLRSDRLVLYSSSVDLDSKLSKILKEIQHVRR